MSTRRSDWVILGTNIGYDFYQKATGDKKDELLDSPYHENTKVNEITYLIDGMNGEYFIVGMVIDCDKDGYEGLALNEILLKESPYPESIQKVKEYIQGQFGLDVEVNLLVLTHWT